MNRRYRSWADRSKEDLAGRRDFFKLFRPTLWSLLKNWIILKCGPDSWSDQIRGRIRPMCALDPVYRAELECPYDVWIDEPLSAHACEAIEELVREKNKLHSFYMVKIDRLRMWEAAKREVVLMKLQEVEKEVEREEFDVEDAF
ncbi:hypothetical protein AgCh_036722 [Apium graveolens]